MTRELETKLKRIVKDGKSKKLKFNNKDIYSTENIRNNLKKHMDPKDEYKKKVEVMYLHY